MKINILVKATPFLSTILLIIFLSISNQKEYTKLRILVWNTPSLTLGRYLALSTGTGFLLSYFITTKISKLNKTITKESLNFKDENIYESNNDYKETNTNYSYDKNLIERDINDPSPTINASFRIIGQKDKSNINIINKNDKYEDSYGFEDQYSEKTDDNENINQVKSILTDWNDESYSRW